MLSDKEFCDAVHLLIHSVRLLPKYSPSEFEKRISTLVIEKFSDTCKECKEMGETKKSQPKKETFLTKLKGALD